MATTPTATDRTDNNSSGPLATLRTLALKPIYPLTRLGATLTTHAALRVTAIGHARAVPPPSQAAMLASSHCGMVMDPAVLIATNQDRQCHFWAKREVWAMPVMAFVFDGLGAVPVARPKMAVGSLGHSIEPTMGSIPRLAAEGGESPGSRERSVTADSTASSSNGGGGANAALWRATSEMLARGQLLCVFPEGTSYTLPHLIAFKDGLSRAALDRARRAKDARESGDTSAQSAPIIPVGVSYVEKTWWRTSVVCTYGDPINVDEYLGKDVSELTREIERRVRLVTVNAPDWDVMRLAQTSYSLLSPTAFPLLPGSLADPVTYVPVMQGLIALFSEYSSVPAVAAARVELERYRATVVALGLVAAGPKAGEYAPTERTWRSWDVLPWASSQAPPTPRAAALTDLHAGVHDLFLYLPLALPAFLFYLPLVGAVTAANRGGVYRESVGQTYGMITLTGVPLTVALVAFAMWISSGWTSAVWTAAQMVWWTGVAVSTGAVDRVREAALRAGRGLALVSTTQANLDTAYAARASASTALRTAIAAAIEIDAAQFADLPYGPFATEMSAPPEHLRQVGKFAEPEHIAFVKRPWPLPHVEVQRVQTWISGAAERTAWSEGRW